MPSYGMNLTANTCILGPFHPLAFHALLLYFLIFIAAHPLCGHAALSHKYGKTSYFISNTADLLITHASDSEITEAQKISMKTNILRDEREAFRKTYTRKGDRKRQG